jgi:predicted PurR-regulated permease PerM
MKLHHFNTYFFLALLFGVGLVVFYIFQPFLTSIVAAAVLAALFQGTYRFFFRIFRERAGWSAAATCLVIFLIIVTPLFIVLGIAVSEANSAYHSIGDAGGIERVVDLGVTALRSMPRSDILFNEQSLDTNRILSEVQQASRNILGILQAAYQGVTGFVIWMFVTFFSLFYFLIDGKRAVAKVMSLSPLRDEYEKLLIRKFVSMSRATIKGTLLIGLIQGSIVWLAFWIAGVPSPVIWGFVSVILSVIPMVGAGIVWFPVGLIMLSLGFIWQGVFILSVGLGIISTIDNVLRPKFVGKDTQMHPLLVFFATIGGIAYFGLFGFIIGPIVLALFMALWDIYAVEFRDQLKSFNEDDGVSRLE